MFRLFWKIRYALRDKYLRKKYKNCEPGFYYDRIIHEYVHPDLLHETSIHIEFVAEGLAMCGLYYPYMIGEHLDHAHEFAMVLKDAYEAAELFSIPEEFESYYSAQELKMCHELVKRGVTDKEQYKSLITTT